MKKLLKVLAGITAILLIGVLFFITSAFVGNPITAMRADRAVKKYLEENYSFLDLEVEKARYNFKDGSYIARAWSKTNIDIHFPIYYRDGKILRDDYNSHVLGMFNTLQRLSEEYSALAKSLVAKELGYENTTMVMYDKSEYGDEKEILQLGMEFDRTLPLQTEVLLRLDLTDNSLESVAKILEDAHHVFIKHGCHFSKYGMFSEADGRLVMVNGVTPSDIKSGKLFELLKEAEKNEDASHISVFIK